jgi:hypothetical protein
MGHEVGVVVAHLHLHGYHQCSDSVQYMCLSEWVKGTMPMTKGFICDGEMKGVWLTVSRSLYVYVFMYVNQEFVLFYQTAEVSKIEHKGG